MSAIWILNVILLVLLLCGQLVIYFYKRGTQRSYEEETLQNERLGTILESGEIVLWTYDVNGRFFTRYNPDMTYVTETLKEMEARLNPDDFSNLMACMSKVRNRVEEQATYVQSGSTKYVNRESEITVTPLVSENGEITKLMAVQHDLTKEKRQLMELDDSNKRFQAIFDLSPFDLYIYDRDGNFVRSNSQAKATFAGRKTNPFPDEPHNLHDNSYLCDIDLSDHEPHHMVTRIAFNDDNECTFGYAVSANHKQRMYYETTIIPIYDDNGDVAYTVIRGIDVTDLGLGYHNMKADNARLNEATAIIMELVKKIDYVLLNLEMQLLCFFPDTRQMVFYKSMGVVQHVLDEIQLFTQAKPDTYPHFIRELQVVNKRLDQPIRFHIHSIYPNKDGGERYLNCTMNPVFRLKKDGSGEREVDYYFGAMTNDTQMVMTTMKLEEEKKRAEESETIKDAFLKNMSYEIRSPLTNVVGFTELLGQEHSPEDEKMFVEQIKTNTDKLLTLVNEVLLLSRLDANMEPLNVEDTNVPEAFNNWLVEAKEKYGRDDVTIELDSPYEELIARLDARKIDMVMDQILINAVTYTHNGSVHMHYEYVGGAIVLTTTDTGTGMDKETLDQIMERFSRGSNKSGTGLGLPICQALMKLMGGNINIQSAPGKGTTVWISVPCNVLSMKKKEKIYV